MSIVIKPADKGSATVIMNRTDYVQEALRQLQDTTYYVPLSKPMYPDTTNLLAEILDALWKKKALDKKQIAHFKKENNPIDRDTFTFFIY